MLFEAIGHLLNFIFQKQNSNRTNDCFAPLQSLTHKLFFYTKICFLFLQFILFTNCFGYLKPNPIIEEIKSEKLKQDKEFLALDENLDPISFPENLDPNKEILKYQNAKTIPEKNYLAIYGIKLEYNLEAEKILIENFKSNPNKLSIYLNLNRFYFILEEYSECRKITDEFLKKNKSLKFKLLDYLQKSNRIEEKIIVLDIATSDSEFESKALEELGTYFLNNRNYSQAEFYFEKVLATYAYNKTALIGMMQIKLDEENYKSVLDFGIHLEKEKPNKLKYTYMQSKSYFELGEYEKAIRLIESSSESEKLDIEVLKIWRDSHYSLDPKIKLEKIKPFLQKLKFNQELQENFFSRESKLGKKNSDFILYGF